MLMRTPCCVWQKAANGVPNHNDLDGGTFVFEADGQRWAMDMGSDSYNLPQYFTQSLEYRYGYYRKSTAGHNTLTFNNDHIDNKHRSECAQDPGMTGRTQISLFEGDAVTRVGNGSGATSSPAYSIVDLTAAYNRQNSSRVERGFAFAQSYERLFIVDEFEFAAVSSVRNVTWTMHTRSTIALAAPDGGRSAALSLAGATLHARVLEPAGAAFSKAAVELRPPYKSSSGINKLMVFLPIVPGPSNPVTRIVVELSVKSTPASAATLNPLAQWRMAGPFVKPLI
jgi:hypothetical protein